MTSQYRGRLDVRLISIAGEGADGASTVVRRLIVVHRFGARAALRDRDKVGRAVATGWKAF